MLVMPLIKLLIWLRNREVENGKEIMNYDKYGFPIIDDDVDYDELFGRKSNDDLKPAEKEKECEIPNAPLFDL